MTGNFQCLQMPSVRIRQGMAVSSLFLFLYGECVYQSIEMYILAYLVHMYKCQSTSLSKDACVRDGDELKSPCMCVNVCMFALKIAANHDLGRVFRLFHQTSSLDLLEPSAVKPSQEVIKAPEFSKPSNARSRISSKSAMPSSSSTSTSNPTFLQKLGSAWVQSMTMERIVANKI